MFQTSEEYREHLESLSIEDLFGEDGLQELVEEEIEGRLDAVCCELEDMDYDELLNEDYLEELAQEEIERRLQAFEEGQQ